MAADGAEIDLYAEDLEHEISISKRVTVEVKLHWFSWVAAQTALYTGGGD